MNRKQFLPAFFKPAIIGISTERRLKKPLLSEQEVKTIMDTVMLNAATREDIETIQQSLSISQQPVSC